MKKLPVPFFVVFFVFVTATAYCAEYRQIAGLMDLRTTFSDGSYSIEELTQLAKQRGFSVIFINDHDRMVLEYGLPPWRNLLKKREERNSINKQGAASFIRAVKEVQSNHPDMIIIPGSETTPFYYWTGNPFTGTLTAHDHERRLLTVGMENPEDYENLPIVHNGFSFRYLRNALGEILFFSLSLVAGIIMIRWRGTSRIFGIVIVILSIGFIMNSNAWRSSPFDPYQGNQGITPYQLLIDYVNTKGGMTFWNYPETRSGVRDLGPIRVSTLPYPQVLQESKDYTGFSALYGDNITLTEPGGIWDTTLKEFCAGYRKQPPWGIATSDYHGEGEGGDTLGTFQTIFFIKEKTKENILSALRNGKMYSCRVRYPQVLRLQNFSVSSHDEKIRGISGDEIELSGFPRIRISLSTTGAPDNKVKVRLIRSGEVIYVFEEKLPLKIDYVDPYYEPGKKIYYRIDMHGAGTIISNPIFIHFGVRS